MIPVRREPDFHWNGAGAEPCCFCRVHTRYRTALPDRLVEEQVPCCQTCSTGNSVLGPRYLPFQVPGRRAYNDLRHARSVARWGA